jgi:hypothetical protein
MRAWLVSVAGSAPWPTAIDEAAPNGANASASPSGRIAGRLAVLVFVNARRGPHLAAMGIIPEFSLTSVMRVTDLETRPVGERTQEPPFRTVPAAT